MSPLGQALEALWPHGLAAVLAICPDRSANHSAGSACMGVEKNSPMEN